MKRVRFDECLDDRKLVRDCQTEGLVEARRFPRDMRNKGIVDEQVLERLLPACDLLVTNDLGLAAQNVELLSAGTACVLVLSLGPESIRTFTTHAARRMLQTFKADYPQWPVVPWSNSVVEITPGYIRIQHVAEHSLIEDAWIDRAAEGWQDQLTAALEQNAGRAEPKAQ
jgi:hypothetical protein